MSEVGKDLLMRAMPLEDWEDTSGDVVCTLGNNLTQWGSLSGWNDRGLVQDHRLIADEGMIQYRGGLLITCLG